jgi:hypothetical protein
MNSNEKIMMRRIKELEAQNDRLKKHVGQAEDAIKNYRGFLSARSTCADDESDGASNDKSCQTMDSHNVVDALQAELNATRRRLLAAEKDGERQQQLLKGALSQKRPQPAAPSVAAVVSVAKADPQPSASVGLTNSSSGDGEAGSLPRRELEAWMTRCGDAERQVAQLSATANSEMKKSMMLADALKAAHSSIVGFKQQHGAEKAAIQSTLDTYQTELASAAKTLNGVNSRLDKSEDEAEALRLSLTLRNSQLNAAELAADQAKGVAKDWEDKYRELEQSTHAKTDAAITTAQHVASVLAAANDRADKEREKEAVSQEKALIIELESKVASLSADREKYFTRFSSAQSLVKRVSKQMAALNDAHEDELKCSKHAAHVKDLGRISAAREITLERDKALNSHSYAKEVEHVLSFCINTLEQSLLETQPAIVSKVAEGRGKRLKQLAKLALANSRDIDQRSCDVLAVSGAALEGFKKKADNKLKDATETRQRVSALLLEQLNMNSSDAEVDGGGDA